MKKIILLVAVMATSMSSYAQKAKVTDNEDKSYEESQHYGRRIIVNKFSDNWELSAKIGTQAYLGEYVHCTPYFKFKDWWTFPTFDVTFQKWATHGIGLSLGFTASKFKSLYMDSERDHATFAKDNDPLYYQSGESRWYTATGTFGNGYIEAIFNMCNLFGGYKPNRVYNAVVHLGGGIMFPMETTKYKEICASFNWGVNNKFSLSKHLTFDIDIRGTLHDDMFNGVSYYTSEDRKNISVDATLGITAGLSYRFNWVNSKKRNAKGHKINEEGWTTVNEVVYYTEPYHELEAIALSTAGSLAAANEKIKELEKIIAEQEKALAHKDTVLREIHTDTYHFKILVNFKIDKWNITNREKVNILYAAEAIKSRPDQKFVVAGFADKQTSNKWHNQYLSMNRANVVYDCLVKEFGVNPDQLVKIENGGVDYMYFNDKQCSRSVLITEYDPEGKY